MTLRKRSGRRSPVPPLEWIAAAIGLLLTLGVLSVVGWEAFRPGDDTPPLIEAKTVGVTPAPGGFVLQVELRNRSRATAAAVQIEGDLGGGPGGAEMSSAMIDYVPGQSTRRVGLFFGSDPRRHSLKLRATGYSEP
jgi:uncharacterized protein (TIGR02588 family)